MGTLTSTVRPIFVVDYADTPFEEVCDLLDAWTGEQISTRHGRRPVIRVGALDRVTDHVARVVMHHADAIDSLGVAELRVLAVSTGHDPLTELLVFVRSEGLSTAGQAVARLRAQSILERAMQRLDTSARDVAPRRAG